MIAVIFVPIRQDQTDADSTIRHEAIYEEAHMYLYSRRFVFVDTYTLHSFLTIIGVKNRAKLHDIEVGEWGYSAAHKAVNYPAISLLADATNLTRFGLNICQWGVSSYKLVFSSNSELQYGWVFILVCIS
jgi:hypothetical protein